MAGVELEALKKTGFARLNLDPAEAFAPYADGGFATPSGKCEFESSLATNGDFVLPVFRQGYEGQQSGASVDALPNCDALLERAVLRNKIGRQSLQLISPKSHAFLNSSYGNLRHQKQHAGEPYVLLHPNDAATRNIAEGDRVRVANLQGTFDAVAHLSDTTQPGVAVAPVGYWRNGSRNTGAVNAVTSAIFADLGHAPVFSDVQVEIPRAVKSSVEVDPTLTPAGSPA